jgi:tetratricopeptide (TPR) repeat protein
MSKAYIRWCCLPAAIVLFSSAALADPASDKFDQGVKALKNRDWDEAIACFDDAIRLNPKHIKAYLHRGDAYQEKGDDDRAIANYTAALRLDQKNSDAFQKRGWAYYSLGILYSVRNASKAREAYDKAIADCIEAIRLDPKNSEAYFTRASAYREKTQYDKALEDFSTAIRLKPTWSNQFYMRGLLYSQTKQHGKAVSDFTEVIRLEAKSDDAFNRVGAYVLRGHAYAGQRAYDKAIADYQEAVRIAPDSQGTNALAWILATCPEAKVRDGKKALEYAKKLCELAEDTDPDLYDILAAAYAENGNFAEAVKWLKKGLASPDFSKDRLEKARARLKLYEQGKPYRDEARAEPASDQFDQGVAARAIVCFDEAIRHDPKDADAFYHRGFAYTKKGQYEKADADFAAAIRLKPNDSRLRFRQGDIYLESKQ